MGVGTGLYLYDVVVKTFTFVMSSTDEFLYCLLVVPPRPTLQRVRVQLGLLLSAVWTCSGKVHMTSYYCR